MSARLIQVNGVVLQVFDNMAFTDEKTGEVLGYRVDISGHGDYLRPMFSGNNPLDGQCYAIILKDYLSLAREEENSTHKGVLMRMYDITLDIAEHHIDAGPIVISESFAVTMNQLLLYIVEMLYGDGAPESFKKYANINCVRSIIQVIERQGIENLINIQPTSCGAMLEFKHITIGVEEDGYAHS